MNQPADIRGPLAPETQRVLNGAWAESALPLPELQGRCERSSLATCSLPVVSVREAIARLEDASKMAERTGDTIRAVSFLGMALNLRAELALSGVRQPAENATGQPREPERHD